MNFFLCKSNTGKVASLSLNIVTLKILSEFLVRARTRISEPRLRVMSWAVLLLLVYSGVCCLISCASTLPWRYQY